MSVVCIIVPAVVGGWPLLSTLAAAAAGGIGFKLLKGAKVQEEKKSTINEIQITEEKSRIIEEELKPEEELVFTKDDIILILKKDVHEKFTICVRGENRSNEELNKIGRLFLNKIKQQYVYKKVKDEMTKKGFNIVQETTEGERIKLVLRRF